MAFCTNCGSTLTDNAKFCQACGARNNATVQAPATPVTPPPSATPAIYTLKRVASSPWMLASAVCVSIVILLLIAFGTLLYSGMMEFMADLMYTLGQYPDMYELEAAAQEIYAILEEVPIGPIMGVIGFAVSLTSAIPMMLVAFGVWSVYANGKRKKMGFGSFAVTFLKILYIVMSVSYCATLAIMLLLEAVLVVTAIVTAAPVETVIVFVLDLLVVVAAGVVLALYYVKIIKSLGAAASVIKTGMPNAKASRFIGVMCIISAISCTLFALLMLILTLVFSGFLFQSVVFGIAVVLYIPMMICMAVSDLGFGVTVFKYRKQMRLCEQSSYTL